MSRSGRGGWVLEGAAACLAWIGLSVAVGAWARGGGPAAGAWIAPSVYLASAAVLLLFLSLREGAAGARERWEALGVRPDARRVREGIAAGVAGLVLLGAVEWGLNAVAGVDTGLHAAPPGEGGRRALALLRERPWVAVGLTAAAGALEEAGFRGWGLLLVRRARPDLAMPALAASSALFAAAHVGAPPGGLLHYALLGLVLGGVALSSRSVVPGAVLHALLNAAVTAAVVFGGRGPP